MDGSHAIIPDHIHCETFFLCYRRVEYNTDLTSTTNLLKLVLYNRFRHLCYLRENACRWCYGSENLIVFPFRTIVINKRAVQQELRLFYGETLFLGQHHPPIYNTVSPERSRTRDTMQTPIYQHYDATQITDELLETDAKFFSQNKGVWSQRTSENRGKFAKKGRSK
jgi:hypothetical protein